MQLASGPSLHLPAMPAEENPPLHNGSAAGVIVFTVGSWTAIETAAYFFGIIIYMSYTLYRNIRVYSNNTNIKQKRWENKLQRN